MSLLNYESSVENIELLCGGVVHCEQTTGSISGERNILYIIFFLVAGVMHVVVVYLFQQRGNSRVAIHRGRRQGASVFENRSNHSHVQDVRG